MTRGRRGHPRVGRAAVRRVGGAIATVAVAAARLAIVAAGLLALASGTFAADRCGDAAPAEAHRRLESVRHVLVFRPVPAPITVGRHFALETQVCARDAAPAPTALRVDALMPEHRHGMNYRASVTSQGDGRFVAEGLLFHMPGRWQLVFDVQSSAGADRLVAEVMLE